MGFIYCCSNPAYGHNVYKIGFTERPPLERMDELYTTGILFPFKLEFAKEIEFARYVETKIHKMLYDFRINRNREFFRISIDNIRDIFNKCKGLDYVFTQHQNIFIHKIEPYFIEDSDGWLEKTVPKSIKIKKIIVYNPLYCLERSKLIEQYKALIKPTDVNYDIIMKL